MEIIENQWHENAEGEMTKTRRKRTKSEDKEAEQIDVKLTLTTLKPIHAKWLVDFYMTSHDLTRRGTKYFK